MAAIAACDAERAAKSLERLGPCPTLSYIGGLDYVTTIDGRKRQVPMPEEERKCRMLELDRWELTQRVAAEERLAEMQAEHEARVARLDAEEALAAAAAKEKAHAAAVGALELEAVRAILKSIEMEERVANEPTRRRLDSGVRVRPSPSRPASPSIP